jgi:uncharacterized membrane protein
VTARLGEERPERASVRALERWLAPFRGLSLPEAARDFAVLAVAAASLAMFLWSLGHYGRLPAYVADNQLPPLARRRLLLLIAGALAVGLGLGVALVSRARAPAAALASAARALAPVMLLAPLPAFFCWRIWTGRELEFALLVAAYGLLAQRAFASAFPELAAGELAARLPARAGESLARLARARRLWLGVTLAAAAGYALFFAHHTIRYHHRALTLSWDLGLEDNLIWNVLHGGPFMKSSPLAGPIDSSHFGYHATLFAYVIAPFYALWPRAELLLLLQAILIAAAALPLYLFAERRVGSAPACLIALAYLLYPAVHGANLYDFHYLPIGVVFLWATLYAIDRERYVLALVFALLTLSIREDMAADLAVLGGFVALCLPRVRAGLLLMAVAAVYFIGMKLLVMPRFLHGGESFIWQWRGLTPPENPGFGGVLMTLLGNPLFALRTLFVPEKLLYVLQLGAPLVFLPWRRRIGWYLCIPGFLFTLMTVDAPPLVQISFQYTAHWVGFLFLALVVNLEAAGVSEHPADPRWPARRHAWLAALALLTMITSYQFGALFQQNTVRGGFARYEFGWTAADSERYAGLRGLIERVPPDAKIVASEYLVAQVSNRADAYSLRLGLYDAEYLLFQIDPGYERDTTLPRSYSRKERDIARQALQRDFGVVATSGDYVLARRGHDQSQNDAVLELLR